MIVNVDNGTYSDRVSFTDNQKIDFLQKAGKVGIEQCFVLSTCEMRQNVYFFAPGKKMHSRLARDSAPCSEGCFRGVDIFGISQTTGGNGCHLLSVPGELRSWSGGAGRGARF